MRRFASVVGIVLVVIGAVIESAAAATPVRSGWWERAVSPLVTTPPPAPVPDGGLRVANAIDGSTAVAALRYELEADSVALALTLTVEAARGAPVVVACRAASPWEPASGGPMSDAPDASCDSAAVAGVPNDDGTTWAFDVSSLRDGRVLDVVLLPGSADGGLPQPTGFDVVFVAPDDAALATEARSPSTAGLGPTTTTTTSAAYVPPTSGVAVAPRPTFAATTTSPVATREARTSPPLDGVPPAFVDGLVASRPGALGITLLATGVAVLALALVGNPSRIAWALGGTRRAGSDDTTIAGLARWAKPRHGSPPGI